MVLRINDNRIGIMNSQRRIVQQFPSYFASGGYWNRQANPTPTTVYFGPDSLFFYVLPVGIARVSHQVRQELEAIVNQAYTADAVTQPVTQPAVQTQTVLPDNPQNQPPPQPVMERTPSSLSQAEWAAQSQSTINQTLQDTGAGGLVINGSGKNLVPNEYPEYDDILPDVED